MRIRMWLVPILALLGLIASGAFLRPVAQSNENDGQWRVVAVPDGDTLVLRSTQGEMRMRLHGVDAPELKQPFGPEARSAVERLARGRVVTFQYRDGGKDAFGRGIAEVFLSDGTSLNRRMVSEGLAWWFRRYAPQDTDLQKREQEAREKQRGLWQFPNPEAPWDWRRRNPRSGG